MGDSGGGWRKEEEIGVLEESLEERNWEELGFWRVQGKVGFGVTVGRGKGTVFRRRRGSRARSVKVAGGRR